MRSRVFFVDQNSNFANQKSRFKPQLFLEVTKNDKKVKNNNTCLLPLWMGQSCKRADWFRPEPGPNPKI